MPIGQGEVCCLLSTLVLDRDTIVLLVKLERSLMSMSDK